MIFRNLTLFRFPTQLGGTAPARFADFFDPTPCEEGASFEMRPPYVEQALAEAALKPVGPMEVASSGFVSPFGTTSETYMQRVGDAVLVTVGSETRILPPAVVEDLLRKKLAEIEDQEGRRVTGRTRKQIKQDLVAELLPRAFVEPSRVSAYFDLVRGFIAVDTSSRGTGEHVVSQVRHAIGSFPALPLNAEVAPRAILTAWLAGDPMPEGLSLGDECELRDPTDKGAVIRIQHLDLKGEEIQQHLQAGMQCTRLAFGYRDHLTFVFGEDLTVRKLKLLDGAMQQLESEEREDVRAELDARFALMAGEVGALFDMLASAFKLTSADGELAPTPDAKPQRRKGRKLPDGIDQITITIPGRAPVTYTADQFMKVGNITERLLEITTWVRSTGKTSISALQRMLGCGYNEAARVVELLEHAGVVSAPAADGTRTVMAVPA